MMWILESRPHVGIRNTARSLEYEIEARPVAGCIPRMLFCVHLIFALLQEREEEDRPN